MAIGPQGRDALRARVHQQYSDQTTAMALVGLDLALRGFELSRRRLDNGAIDWDQYVPLRGHYNATAHGVLDALQSKGLTPQAALLWKKTQARYWTELEEPPFMARYCQEIFDQLIPHLLAPHSSLRALNNMLVSFKEKGSDPKSAAVIRSSIESNTTGMNKAGFGIEVRALRSIHGFDANADFLWMEKYLPKLNGPVAQPAPLAPSAFAVPQPLRKKGLQKCSPTSDFYSEPVDIPEPVGEPWEEALGTPAGAIVSPKVVMAPAAPARPKGLQKSSANSDPFDIGDDSFGL